MSSFCLLPTASAGDFRHASFAVAGPIHRDDSEFGACRPSVTVAVEYLPPGEETNPETLEQLKSHATSLSLNEGEPRTLDLKLSSY